MAEPCGWGPTPQGGGSGVGNSHPTRLALLATLPMKGREGAGVFRDHLPILRITSRPPPLHSRKHRLIFVRGSGHGETKL